MAAVIIPPLADIGSAVVAIDMYIYNPANSGRPVSPNAVAAGAQYFASPIDKIVTACEAMYASAPVLDAAGWTLCAQLANLCMAGGWHGLGQTGRGLGIVQAMRRMLGDDTITQTADQDPVPELSFLPPSVAPPPPTTDASSIPGPAPDPNYVPVQPGPAPTP